MISLLINLIVIALVLGVAWWIITLLPLPAPFPLIIRVVFVLIALIIAVHLLYSLSGSGSRGSLLW